MHVHFNQAVPERKRTRSLFVLSCVCICRTIYKSPTVEAHMRWTCPEARNPDTGIKGGPCGPETDQFAAKASIEIAPGPLTVQWEESITHAGAPFYIALTQDGRDTDTFLLKSCILLDHIPHNDFTSPNFYNESTFELYSLTIDIPNVSCSRCSLHIVNPMTDKIGVRGAPNGTGCTYPGFCGGIDVYHSCTLPIKINGTTPRKDYVCPNRNPSDWPNSWMGDNKQRVNATKRLEYRRESGKWKDSFLMDVAAKYRQIAQPLKCINTNYKDPVRRTSAPRITPRPLPSPSPGSSNGGAGILGFFLSLIQNFLTLFFRT
jgi:hypothetical protein